MIRTILVFKGFLLDWLHGLKEEYLHGDGGCYLRTEASHSTPLGCVIDGDSNI